MGRRILIPHEDKVDVITPVNLLFGGVTNFNVTMIMMWWCDGDDDDDDDDDHDHDHDHDHDDGKCGATSGLGRTC